MLIIDQFKTPISTKESELKIILASKLKINIDSIKDIKIIKKSIDARKKPEVFYVYSIAFHTDNEGKLLKKNKDLRLFEEKEYKIPSDVNYDISKEGRPVVIGAGPAGLFCGLILAMEGLKPIVLERGKSVDERKSDIDYFWNNGKLLLNSNVQFGEGGAGTFSDGKLNTLVKDKDGKIKFVLKTFVRFGAKESIVYDSKPHIGTDVLIDVVKNIRNEIINLGGEVFFESQVTDLDVSNGEINAVYINDSKKIDCKNIVLAIGHSARDTFYMLRDKKLMLEQKPFAVGFRVIHNQSMIDKSQYGFDKSFDFYPGAAPYKLACKVNNGRNVYSFCMCPGGYVVNASSEHDMLAINGMSYSKRDSSTANSAILINVNCEDFPSKDVLAGVDLQRNLEQKAFSLGKGKIPYCRFADFIGESSNDLEVVPDFKGQSEYVNLNKFFNEEFTEAFVDGMKQFGKTIKGFDSPKCIVAAVESRSSSPVRITRNENFESLNIKGVFPCGEGAGYAGGIVSAAVDGIRVAEAILRKD